MRIESAKPNRQFPSRQVVRILACAVVLGLVLPAAFFGFLAISMPSADHPPTWAFILTVTLTCLGSYLSAGLLLAAIERTRRSGYWWLLLSVVGSLALTLVFTFIGLPVSQLTVSQLFFGRALAATFLLILFTAPFSALFYYAAALVRLVTQPIEPLHVTER
jgi:drug/metabolite transporter (DMT)-like permease